MADRRNLEDILKMDDAQLRRWHTARLWEIGNLLDQLPCRTENGTCNTPSRVKKLSLWSAVGVFAGSSVVGLVLGILNWLGRI